MKITYDPKVDALDVVFKEGKVKETREISAEVFLDVDEKGTPLSLEILGARKKYHPYPIKEISFELPELVKSR